jgi:hypothetical protein
MKKLLLLLILSLSLSGCGIAQVSQKPLIKVRATVSTIVNDIAVLDTSEDFDYQAFAGELEIYKEYLFLLEIVDCGHCNMRKAVVVWYSITPNQAQRDMNTIPEELAHRVIIKL